MFHCGCSLVCQKNGVSCWFYSLACVRLLLYHLCLELWVSTLHICTCLYRLWSPPSPSVRWEARVGRAIPTLWCIPNTPGATTLLGFLHSRWPAEFRHLCNQYLKLCIMQDWTTCRNSIHRTPDIFVIKYGLYAYIVQNEWSELRKKLGSGSGH